MKSTIDIHCCRGVNNIMNKLHSSCGCSKQNLAWSAQWKRGPLSEGKHWLKTRPDGPQRSSSSCSRAPTVIKHSKGHPTANRHTTRSSPLLSTPPANRQWLHYANEMERIVSDVNDQKRAQVSRSMSPSFGTGHEESLPLGSISAQGFTSATFISFSSQIMRLSLM